MYRGVVAAHSPLWCTVWSSGGPRLHLQLVLTLFFLSNALCSVCPPPPEPENGGFLCHPPHCDQPLTSGSVIEYFCAEGFMLKGDYKFLTCKNGAWNPPMGVSCRQGQETNKHTSLGVPTLSIVASTASSVALILLLIVLFVLLQPKLKSFHHNRREGCVAGEQVSIMVDGVQVALPSYEEAVYGSAGNCIPSASSRVQIVLSEGPGEEQDLQQSACSSNSTGQTSRGSDLTGQTMGHAMQGATSSRQHSETVMVHQTSSSWASGAEGRTLRGAGVDSESSDVQSLLSLSSDDYTDDVPLLKEA
ncbi:sushi domain-containing protein 6 [Spea bombifrons]|uniref:sushi domain-containing protein 6 n=1 Tax=Spea bombifrons TaxID=233779 RepID=UPI00234BB1B8|nr:sushi domain-containing protein 6 [Spea bombifrons]